VTLNRPTRVRARFVTAFAIACAVSFTNLNVTPVSASGALTLNVDYTPDSTAIATEVTPGSKVDLTAVAPVSIAGTTSQMVTMEIEPYLTLTGASDIRYPAGWAVSYSVDGTTWTTVAPTTTTPWSSYRGDSRTTSGGATTSQFVTTEVGGSQVALSALRLITPNQAKTFLINPLTPKVCLGSGTNIAFIATGRCTFQVVRRSNGTVMTTKSTRVVAGTVTPSDILVALAPPTVVYFNGGTALVKTASKKAINALAPSARAASSVIVTGHSGNMSGENSDLVVLSQKRANSVRSLLRGRGVNQTIAIWSFGASAPVTNSKSNAKQNLNRRAEIYLIP